MKITRWIAAGPLLLASTLALATPSAGQQPRMQAALASLKEARASLEQASTDKGGHRKRAILAIDRAIKQVEAGIEFDRTHTSKDEAARKAAAAASAASR